MSRGKIIFIIILLMLGVGTAGLYWSYRSGQLQKLIVREAVKRTITGKPDEINVIDSVLGFEKPRTYLVLFLNNTELRPGGGFIGVYAVVRLDQAYPTVIKVEGTEIIDNLAPKDFAATPPEPLAKYLGVTRWGFRDSNWSPDFPTSARTALDLYTKERGLLAGEIDGVIGITPTVMEEILKITGPVTARGITFDSSNFTEKLEYEVEYGYRERGIPFDERKGILSDLARLMASRLASEASREWRHYLTLAERLLAEKQIIMYSRAPAEQALVLQKGWGGEMRPFGGDYLLWADANLGALKTDASIERSLTYTLAPGKPGTYVATAAMQYKHVGAYDWRTRRYRTYTRVFVPEGSKLRRVRGSNGVGPLTVIKEATQGVENGRRWFGVFTTVEIGRTGALQFEFEVAPEVARQIKAGAYALLAQKQIGTSAVPLTLQLDFGKTVTFAKPPEESQQFGDNRYDQKTDLRVDRNFEVKLETRN